MVAWAVLTVLALGWLVAAFLLFAGASIGTVVGSSRRARRRAAGLGPLAAAFPQNTLEGLDEALERAWLQGWPPE